MNHQDSIYELERSRVELALATSTETSSHHQQHQLSYHLDSKQKHKESNASLTSNAGAPLLNANFSNEILPSSHVDLSSSSLSSLSHPPGDLYSQRFTALILAEAARINDFYASIRTNLLIEVDQFFTSHTPQAAFEATSLPIRNLQASYLPSISSDAQRFSMDTRSPHVSTAPTSPQLANTPPNVTADIFTAARPSLDSSGFSKDEDETRGSADNLLQHELPLAFLPVSHPKKRSKYAAKAQDLYTRIAALQDFVELNYKGFSKALKKFDKVLNGSLLQTLLPTVEKYTWCQENMETEIHHPPVLKSQLILLTDHYATVQCHGDRSKSVLELTQHLRDTVSFERNTVWRDMVGQQRKTQGLEVKPKMIKSKVWHLKIFPGLQVIIPRNLLLCIACLGIAIVLGSVGIFKTGPQNRCFGLLVYATLFWALEVSLSWQIASLMSHLIDPCLH